MNADEVLLGKINKAVAAANRSPSRKRRPQQTELVSRSKVVGELLLEAKKRHPRWRTSRPFLKRVDGLKLSRAYDYLRLAGGRVTDEELREESSSERKPKSREKQKKLPRCQNPLPAPDPKPTHSVTEPPVTESPEIRAEQRRAEYAALDNAGPWVER